MTEFESASGSDLIHLLQPIAALSVLRAEELRPLCRVETIPAGMTLFREEDLDHQNVYLLHGEVLLSSAACEYSCVLQGDGNAGNPARSLYPLADSQPRRMSGVAVSDLGILRIDSELLDIAVTWNALAHCLAADDPVGSRPSQDGTYGWMRTIRHCLVFRDIPPANLPLLAARTKVVPVRAGQVMIREGEQADRFYMIESGKAAMMHETDRNGPVDVTELGPGSGFGDESLAETGGRSRVTVTMETRGSLLSLARQDYLDLRNEPPISQMAPASAVSMAGSGAIWLDVRGLEEAPNFPIPNAYRVPLDTLCQVADSLEPDRDYVCCCNSGRRSAVAARLLGQRGLRAHVLAGGLRSVAAGFWTNAMC